MAGGLCSGDFAAGPLGDSHQLTTEKEAGLQDTGGMLCNGRVDERASELGGAVQT